MSFQFIHPQYLWFLLLLLIPIIIHLFNFKRFTKVYFSNLRFLKTLNTEHKKKSKLKKLLVLLLRLLALSCIIIAFAQPFIANNSKQNNNNKKNESVIIYIDNSFSMNANTKQGKALEIAKNKAFELIKSVANYTKIRIYTNDITHFTSSLTKNQAIARVQEIQASPTSINLSEQLKNIEIDKKEESIDVFILSDFQKYQSDFENLKTDSLTKLFLIPLKIQTVNNLLLDTCWFEKPCTQTKAAQELFVNIKNNSEQNFQKIPVQLSINDSIKAIASVNIKAKSKEIVKLKYTNPVKGICKAKVEISDYPITYDNNLYFSYKIDKKPSVLVINQYSENQYINNLFNIEDEFVLTNISKSKLFKENINKHKLLILNEIIEIESGLSQNLKEYLNKGGNILFVPGEKINKSLNSFLSDISALEYMQIDSSKQRLSNIEQNTEIYKDVFKKMDKNARLPDIFKHYKLSSAKNKLAETIWTSAGNDVLFSKQSYGTGNFYQLSINLNSKWTNLITHPIFIPSIINLTKNGNSSDNLYFQTGKNNTIEIQQNTIHANDEAYHIINSNLKTDIIPQQFTKSDRNSILHTKAQIKHSGNYNITKKDSIIQICSFNHSRKESNTEYYSFAEVENKTKHTKGNVSVVSPSEIKLSTIYHEQRNTSQIWRIFVLLCIAFFVTEGIIQRKRT
nr:BatA domain-containing protein [uncultured Marinifilum sp.]